MPFLPPGSAPLVQPDKPPTTPCPAGYVWQYFEGCTCAGCEFYPHCLGCKTPRWRQVRHVNPSTQPEAPVKSCQAQSQHDDTWVCFVCGWRGSVLIKRPCGLEL